MADYGADTAGRNIGGYPVLHGDFSPVREFGSHWQWADQLRESSPLYYNTYAQGYWIFTRNDAVRDIYRNADIFSDAT